MNIDVKVLDENRVRLTIWTTAKVDASESPRTAEVRQRSNHELRLKVEELRAELKSANASADFHRERADQRSEALNLANHRLTEIRERVNDVDVQDALKYLAVPTYAAVMKDVIRDVRTALDSTPE